MTMPPSGPRDITRLRDESLEDLDTCRRQR
jgi:hypothetical protein